MKKLVALAVTGVLTISGCSSAPDGTGNPTPTTRTYTTKPGQPLASKKPEVKKTSKAALPDSGYQRLGYGETYRWNIDGESIAVYVSDPAVSKAVVTNAGTQIVSFNVYLNARTHWSGKSAKLSFDSKTNENFYLITSSDSKPFSEDLNAGQTKLYRMKLEAPMDTYKQGSITLSYNGEKIATWS